MIATIALIELIGYVVLLLWGMRMVQRGVVRAFGSNLRRVLGRALRNRFASTMQPSRVFSRHNPFHLIEAEFFAPTIVELRRASLHGSPSARPALGFVTVTVSGSWTGYGQQWRHEVTTRPALLPSISRRVHQPSCLLAPCVQPQPAGCRAAPG
jgi:hypothetical protein